MDDGVLTNALIRVSSKLKPKIKRWREDTYQKFLTTAARCQEHFAYPLTPLN